MRKKSAASPFGRLKNDASDMQTTKTYFDLRRGDSHTIADEQCNDLNLDDFFDFSNRCISPVGEMLLYARLRRLSREDTEKEEAIIARISGDETFRRQVEEALSGLADKGEFTASNLLHLSVSLSRWHRYLKLLPGVYLLLLIVVWLFAPAYVLLLCGLCILVANTLIHFWNKRYVAVCIRPLGQLGKIRAAASRLIRVDRYHRLEPVEQSIDRLGRLGRKVGVFGMNRWMESEFTLAATMLIEMIKAFFLVEPLLTHSLSLKIVDIDTHAKRLFEYLGGWDVLYSVASFREWLTRNGCRWSIPVFTAGNGRLSADGIRHPLIADCVPNSMTIDGSLVITGSNMSGKSSFLKTIGLNVVAAYAMNTCFADRLVLPHCDLHTVLSVTDDIGASQSSYYSEARRIKAILDCCEKSESDRMHLVLIDEIFSGTNTIERISVAHAVIAYLAGLNNTSVVVTTHDIELARSFEGLLGTCHFSERMERDNLLFNYKMMPGTRYTRNAISILKSCHYPEAITARAELNALKIGKSMDSIRL